jgi:hypothetical protein
MLGIPLRWRVSNQKFDGVVYNALLRIILRNINKCQEPLSFNFRHHKSESVHRSLFLSVLSKSYKDYIFRIRIDLENKLILYNI